MTVRDLIWTGSVEDLLISLINELKSVNEYAPAIAPAEGDWSCEGEGGHSEDHGDHAEHRSGGCEQKQRLEQQQKLQRTFHHSSAIDPQN